MSIFHAALAAVNPRRVVLPHLPAMPQGRLIVLGAGKGSAAMAQAVEGHYGDPVTGVVVTRDGYNCDTRRIEVLTAGHPEPDQRSVAAAQRILALACGAGPDDLVLCLLSGGASALMCLPAPGIDLAVKQNINRALLNSGAAIAEINCVRKHLSAIKGGRLAQACLPAKVVSLIISDVAGDAVSVIGSGPTAADPTTCFEAIDILLKYKIAVPDAVMSGLKSQVWESPKSVFGSVRNIIVARPGDAFAAARTAVRATGLACLDLGDGHEGDAAVLAAEHAQRIRRILAGKDDVSPPCIVLSGGEAGVRVRGPGRGGPNTQFALELALQLQGASRVWALSCDSDGTDGNGDHAGALVTPDTLARAAALGRDPRQALQNNDTASFFADLGDLVVTGPTLTNVNDIRIALVM